VSKVKATARVRITLDIPLTGTWGPECTVEQIQKQAKNEALGLFKVKVIAQLPPELQHARVVGEPIVTGIFAEEDR